MYADCSKDDIEFYLDKGFTQAQITQLCTSSGDTGGSASNIPDYTPYQQKVIVYTEGEGPSKKDGLTKEERSALQTLKKGTDVYNLKVDPTNIKFTRRVCLITGNGRDIDYRYKDCPRVDFTIARENMIVDSAGKKFAVFGQGTVTIKGSVTPVLQGSFEDYPVEFRQGLERNFNWKEAKNETNIPVRGDFSITAVANAFRTLSSDSANEELPGESILDAEAAEEPVREARVDSKKKKKWWNPFD